MNVWKILSVTGLLLVFNMPNANADIPTNGLVGYWTGNGNANDSSTTGNNGSFSGSYVAGINGDQAFDLSTGNVTIPYDTAYSFTNSFSVGFNFNVNGNPQGVYAGIDDGGGEQNKWFIDYGYLNPGSFEIHFNSPSLGPVFIPSNPVSLSSNVWYQFSMVNDSGNISFYLNGTNIGNSVFSGVLPIPTAPLTLGFAEGGINYYGLLSNVVLYNRALSVSEVQSLAAVPVPSAVWLFGTALIGLLGLKRRKQ